jgi:hypothetical protein
MIAKRTTAYQLAKAKILLWKALGSMKILRTSSQAIKKIETVINYEFINKKNIQFCR